MASTRRLTELGESAVNRIRLPEGRLVVALSGGADSAALAYLALLLGRDVSALHVNHGFHDSGTMQSAAAEIAALLDIALSVSVVDVPQGASPEGQARRARYSAFNEAMTGSASLLTGHTMDDDVETIVFNLIRGTGPRGLSGIPYYRPPDIYRPILAISRSETREIAALASLPFVDDPMNDDPGLSRNVVRTRVLPALKALNPRLAESVVRMASSIGDDSEFLDAEASKIPVQVGEGWARVALGDLLATSRPVARRVLMDALKTLDGDGLISTDNIDSVWSLVEGRAVAHELGGGTTARLVGPNLEIGMAPTILAPSTVDLIPGVHRSGRLELVVLDLDEICSVVPLSKWAAVFPSGTHLRIEEDGWVYASGERAWLPGQSRLPVAWYEAGSVGYLSLFANEVSEWTSSR